MRIVVTGAAGFIGQNLIKFLNTEGFHRIVAVDTVESVDRLTGLIYEEFFTPDIVSFQKGDVLVHLGAYTDTMQNDYAVVMGNNFDYSVDLIRKAWKEGCRVIYASSAGVYGNGDCFIDSEDVDEIDNLTPTTVYASSKKALDWWNVHTGTKCVGLRFFNVWGDREQHKGRMESIVSKKYHEIKLGLPQQLYYHPAKSFSRDFIYVKDVVKVIKGFIYSDKTGIYNVGTGVSLPWHELITNYFEVFGNTAIIEPIEFPKERENNYQFYTKSDNTKLLNLDFMRGYEFYHIQDALKDFIYEREQRIQSVS